jgi:hypothetical protein
VAVVVSAATEWQLRHQRAQAADELDKIAKVILGALRRLDGAAEAPELSVVERIILETGDEHITLGLSMIEDLSSRLRV